MDKKELKIIVQLMQRLIEGALQNQSEQIFGIMQNLVESIELNNRLLGKLLKEGRSSGKIDDSILEEIDLGIGSNDMSINKAKKSSHFNKDGFDLSFIEDMNTIIERSDTKPLTNGYVDMDSTPSGGGIGAFDDIPDDDPELIQASIEHNFAEQFVKSNGNILGEVNNIDVGEVFRSIQE